MSRQRQVCTGGYSVPIGGDDGDAVGEPESDQPFEAFGIFDKQGELASSRPGSPHVSGLRRRRVARHLSESWPLIKNEGRDFIRTLRPVTTIPAENETSAATLRLP
jgi:hypothetical protein